MKTNTAIVIAIALLSLLSVTNSQLKLDRQTTLASQGLQQCLEKVPNFNPKILWKKECK